MVYRIKDMETNIENLILAIRSLSEYYDQKIIIKNGIKEVRREVFG